MPRKALSTRRTPLLAALMLKTMFLDTVWVFATRILMRGANFIVLALLARAVPVADFGFYGYLITTTLIVSTAFDLGLRQSTAYVTGQSNENRAAVTSCLVGLWFLLSIGACFATWGVLAGGGFDVGSTAILWISALVAAPLLFIRIGQGVFLGLGQIQQLNYSEILARVLLVLVTVPLWYMGVLDLATAVWALLATSVVGGAYLLWQLREYIHPKDFINLPLARRLFVGGLPFAGAGLLTMLYGRVGVWIVNGRVSGEAVGYYFGALRISEMLLEIAMSIGVVIFSHGVRNADGRQAAANAVRVARSMLFVMAMGSLVALVLSKQIIAIVLGPAFVDAATTFRILLVGSVFGSLVVMLYPGLSSQGQARFGVYVFGGGLVLHAFLCWVLIGPFGLEGAAAAFVIAQITIATALVLTYRKLYGLGVGEILVPQREDVRKLMSLTRRFRRGT